MTLERWTDRSDSRHVRLVECPFCGERIGPRGDERRRQQTSAATHLRQCAAFYRRMGVDPDDPLPLTSAPGRRRVPADPPHP